MMNRFQPNFTGGREARVRYLASDFQVVEQGEFVRCGVSGKPIPLDRLRYWNVELQEAYATAECSMQRHLDGIEG